MRDQSTLGAICDPGPGSRGYCHCYTGAGRLRRLGQEKREKHGLGATQIRPDCQCSCTRIRTLHRLQYEPGQVVGTGSVEQSVVPSLDLLVRADRWRPCIVVHVQDHLRREREYARGAGCRGCRFEQRRHPEDGGMPVSNLLYFSIWFLIYIYQYFSI